MPEPANPERAIDEVCDRFEARWRAGEPPVLEDYLGAVPDTARDELLRELLRLEIDYRRRRGEQPALGDYLPRWPQRNALLQELLGEVLRLGEQRVLQSRRQAPPHPTAPAGRYGRGRFLTSSRRPPAASAPRRPSSAPPAP
jgi:hypothetical protein